MKRGRKRTKAPRVPATPAKSHCKNGHPRVPENLTGSGNCRICQSSYFKERRAQLTRARHASKDLGPVVGSPVTNVNRCLDYWMCTRCEHGWLEGRKDVDSSITKDDGLGFHEFVPPKLSCPKCGSKYNLRHFQDYKIHTTANESFYNYDPFTGRDI